MFSIDASIRDLKVKDRSLFKVLFSMNNHQVANPEMSLEEARSYVFFFRDGGKMQAYVGLYFIPSDRRMFYTHSSNPFPESELANVEEEARNFAEDLGAMLDEFQFSNLSDEERTNWMEAQEILTPKKKEGSPAPAVEGAPAGTVPSAADQTPAPAVAAAAAPVPLSAQPAAPVPAQQTVAAEAQPAVVQPPAAPAAQPHPAPLAAPQVQPVISLNQQPVQQSAPAAPVQPITPPAVQEVAVPVETEEIVQQPPARRKRAAAQPSAQPEAERESERDDSSSMDAVLEEAVRAGVVKAPKAQLKKDIRSAGATGSIGREKEALARLLSSF